MPEAQSIHVRVPATTANLGPGFDCLALSLDIWNEVELCFKGNSLLIEIVGEGQGSLPTDQSNLVFQTIEMLAHAYQIELPAGVYIRCQNRIPVSSGLGSSSSAIIAGLLGGSNLLGIATSKIQLLELGYELEGHLDNLAACLCGGFTIAVMQDRTVKVSRIDIKDINVLIALPDVILSTQDARRVLPQKVSLKDAVFNVGRTALLVSAFCQNDLDWLKVAMEDRLHQPYRYELIPAVQEVVTAAVKAGALGAAISGAGPGLIAFLKNEDEGRVANAMQQAFFDKGVSSRIFKTRATNLGAHIL